MACRPRFFPPPVENNVKTEEIFFAIHDNTNSRNKGYMDLTGKFPYQSARGAAYLLVAYNYDANAILVETLKNKQAKTITTAWEKSINGVSM